MSTVTAFAAGVLHLSGLLVVLLAAFLVGALWQAARANTERRRAERFRRERDALRRAQPRPWSVVPEDVEREASERRARIVVLVGERADQAGRP